MSRSDGRFAGPSSVWGWSPEGKSESSSRRSGTVVLRSRDDGIRQYQTTKPFEGVIPNLDRRWKETDSSWVREELERFQHESKCETCGGARLKPEALAVKIAGLNISQTTEFSIGEAVKWFLELAPKLTPKQREIAARILKEINERLASKALGPPRRVSGRRRVARTPRGRASSAVDRGE